MFDPKTLPIAIPGDPSKFAKVDTISSGKDVPNATIVNPTTKGGTPKRRADDPDLVQQSTIFPPTLEDHGLPPRRIVRRIDIFLGVSDSDDETPSVRGKIPVGL